MLCRRDFLLSFAASAVMAPLFAKAQQTAKPRTIGLLTPYSASFLRTRLDAFKQGLADLGYVSGKNIVIEERHTDGRLERLDALATELIRIPLAVLVTHGSTAADVARRKIS